MSLLFLAVLCVTATASDVMVLPLAGTREFACTSPGPGYSIAWGVNGIPAANSQFQDYIVLGEVHFENGGIQRNLTFTADARANNTHIHCVATHFITRESVVRVDVTILIQGPVSPPDVTYVLSSDYHSVRFSWSAPFTLNISDTEPDILHYVVYIIRDDGHKETVNTRDTHYELRADPCQSHQYHVEIAAVNVVGEGEKYISPEITLEGYAVADVPDVAISFNGRMVLIEIIFGATPPQCREMHFEVMFAAVYSPDRLLFNSNGSTLSLNANDNNLRTNELYNLLVYIEGLPNSKSKSMNISTFDVQNVTTAIHYDDQLSDYVVDITCYFTKGSDAKGCRIVAHPQPVNDNIKACEFVATKEGRYESTVTVSLLNGIYTLMIYDDEEEAAQYPAFTTTLSVHSSQHIPEYATDSKLYTTSLNNAVVSVAAATGGVLLFVVTSFMCLAVSIILIRRKRKKAAIVMAPKIAYEEVKLKQKKRHTGPSHGQPVVALNQDQ